MTTDTVERDTPAQRAAADEGDGAASTMRQFVTFVAGDEVFAVDMAPVQEIIRLPEVVRVPLAPATLDGLANLRGKVLPIISLRRLFGFAERAPDDSTRAVVIDVGQPLGFVVDRVASVVGVEADQIEGMDAISSAVDTELLCGVIKNLAGHDMVMVLDFAKLIAREFAPIGDAAGGAGRPADAMPADGVAGAVAGEELQLVSFKVAQQEYAIAIEDVQEIVQVPDSIIHVPHAAPHVVGVMTLRNRLLPVMDLRRMFGLPASPLDDKSRLIVLFLDGGSVALAVDGVSEVLRVARGDVDAMPPLLAQDAALADISAICRLDDGRRMVSIVTIRNLLDNPAIQEALLAVNHLKSDRGDNANDHRDADEALDDDEQVVVFLLGREEFGVPIQSVQEIVRVPGELVHVPRAAGFVEGVINLRGSVLPVIDLRLRLGLPALARCDGQRIMVFLLAGVRTGFIVDQVAEVLKIPRAVIEPAPRLSGQRGDLLSRMANMERQGRMVQLLDPDQLIDHEHMAALEALEPAR
nr:chemotaxis protein CheW [uncultured Duganella sp.]